MAPSAFEIARSIGYKGTEAEFLEAVKQHPYNSSPTKGITMDYGQTELSRAQACACGRCNQRSAGMSIQSRPASEIDQNHPLLQLLAKQAAELPQFTEFRPVAQAPVTEESLMEKGKKVMAQSQLQHPSEEGFREFLGMMLGALSTADLEQQLQGKGGFFDRPSAFSPEAQQAAIARGQRPENQAERGIEQILPKFLTEGIFGVPAMSPEQVQELIARLSRGGLRAQPQPVLETIPEEVKIAGSDETLQNFITEKLIPGHIHQLLELQANYSGQDLLRQQRRVVARMQKLMQYQTRPESIQATAINDDYELAIYKHYIAKQILASVIKVTEGIHYINSAIAGMNARILGTQENQVAQSGATAEQQRQEKLNKALDEMTAQVSKLGIGEAMQRLRGVAIEFLGEDSTEENVSRLTGELLDQLGIRVLNRQRQQNPQVRTAFDAAFSTSYARQDMHQSHLAGDLGLYGTRG